MVSVMAVWLRRAVQVLLLVVFALALTTAREVHRGEAALRESDDAFDRGDLHRSVLQARAAALCYVPGAPHVSAAYERLEAIGRGAEAEGRYEVARLAWGAVRTSVLQTRHWLVPRSAELERAERALDRLNRAAALRAEAGSLARPEPPERGVFEFQEAAGAASPGQAPRLFRLGLLAFGFAALGLGLGWAAFRVIDERGEVSRRGLWFALALCFGGAACWLLAVLSG